MNTIEGTNGSARVAMAAASLWALWGVLHVWVAGNGIHLYPGGARPLWDSLLGGANAPRDAFQHTTDAVTANVHAHLLLNFCLDVGGYGLLGLAIAWALWKRPAWGWPAYLLGVVMIGVADLSFLFLQVVAGTIEANAGTVGGPVIWFVACVLTPFGLPSARRGVAGAA